MAVQQDALNSSKQFAAELYFEDERHDITKDDLQSKPCAQQ